jgi:hypothetical protein
MITQDSAHRISWFQTLLVLLVKEYPTLFNVVHGGWFDAFRLWNSWRSPTPLSNFSIFTIMRRQWFISKTRIFRPRFFLIFVSCLFLLYIRQPTERWSPTSSVPNWLLCHYSCSSTCRNVFSCYMYIKASSSRTNFPSVYSVLPSTNRAQKEPHWKMLNFIGVPIDEVRQKVAARSQYFEKMYSTNVFSHRRYLQYKIHANTYMTCLM